ncbi:hypothetical protein [Campylobacter hyointestinalis]|uniref:hypothetical protein n=1 Tax=Campylobacter hyointestinalis TaxID=198 RepID=UPI000DCB58F2|nr:hypothetical protein [Campylobacter hyointestinalis]RAZ48201.1 hypothetical protein CHL14416_02970 [Campylobacter hyointestinalis subsp. lawsonii]
MQTFSDMQRNSINLLSIRFVLFCVGLIAYEIMSAANHFLPPLIGLFFAYLVVLKNESEKYMGDIDKRWYLSFIFIIYAEQIHGFELFSTILAFILFYNFINDQLKINMKCRGCLLVIFVFSGYIGTFLLSDLILYILNQPLLGFNYEYYMYYIVVESAISVMLFKERVL